MNRDDIIRMAKEAGLTPEPFCRWGGYTDDLERFAALVAAHEREACAKVCEALANDPEVDEMAYRALREADEAIRARGQENKA